MMKYIGDILRYGKVVERGVRVNLRLFGKHWSGELELPKQTTIYLGSYELHLNDGRAGKIGITVIKGDTALFEGDGKLQ
jgi:hypothetical protein